MSRTIITENDVSLQRLCFLQLLLSSVERMLLTVATASADQKIKVWKKDPVKGTWDLEDEWKVRYYLPHCSFLPFSWILIIVHPTHLHSHEQAHDAPVLQLAWSHPEHSNLLASCSYDRSVRIWEEVSVPAASRNGSNGNATAGGTAATSHSSAVGKRWIECGLLMDARGSVRNIEFAPNAFGLKLVSSSLYWNLSAIRSRKLILFTCAHAGDHLHGFIRSNIHVPLANVFRLATHYDRVPALIATLASCQEQRQHGLYCRKRRRISISPNRCGWRCGRTDADKCA